MEYNIPELNTLSALEFTSAINKIDLSSIDESVFVADMKWVRPFGMLTASTAIKHLRNQYPDIPFRIQCSTNRNGVSYAAHMGFFKSISEKISIGNSPGEAIGNDNYLPITQLDLVQLHNDDIASGQFGALGDSIEKKSAELSNIICRNNIEMQALMTYLIREILRNIPEHANESTAWICGQYWADHTAEIAIVDEGVGVKSSLQRNAVHRQYVIDDETALLCAIKAGISQSFIPDRGNRSSDVWSNSGYGLYMVSEIYKELKGSFCIASGKNYIYVGQDGVVSSGEAYMQGTAVKMTFSTDYLKSSREIIQSIASRGEAEARTIRNAFKKASRPSKGLILEL